MGKKIDDAVLDGMLNVIHGVATHQCATSGEPTDYSNMVSLTLANSALSGATTLGAGDVDGRKATIQAITAVSISASGTANHVCLHDNSASLLLTTTATDQALTSGGTVDFPEWTHTLRQLT